MTEPAQVRLRRAGTDDLDVLLALNAEYCEADGHRFDAGIAARGLTPLLQHDRHGGVWLIIVEPDLVEGYVVLAWSWSVEIGGAEAVLDELYVRTRGRGTGGRAVELAVEECRRAGMRRVFLESERPNEAARRLYARHGFSEDDSIWMSRPLG